MKRFFSRVWLPILAGIFMTWWMTGCERHDWEESKVLFESHGGGHDDHGDGHDKDHKGEGDDHSKGDDHDSEKEEKHGSGEEHDSKEEESEEGSAREVFGS